MCMCNFACKGRSQNDLYYVGRDVKPYSLWSVVFSRLCLWYDVSSIFLLSATFCAVAKRYIVMGGRRWYCWIGR